MPRYRTQQLLVTPVLPNTNGLVRCATAMRWVFEGWSPFQKKSTLANIYAGKTYVGKYISTRMELTGKRSN